MARPLVIGYGNTLRGDDGVGWSVADRLAADPRLSGVDVLRSHQLTPEFALDVSRASAVVFVDATVSGPAGRVNVAALDPVAGGTASSHHMAPETLLALSQALYGAQPPAWLVSVGCATLELGDGLSDVVAAALPAAVDAVIDLLGAPIGA